MRSWKGGTSTSWTRRLGQGVGVGRKRHDWDMLEWMGQKGSIL